jgi:hypothetical protein
MCTGLSFAPGALLPGAACAASARTLAPMRAASLEALDPGDSIGGSAGMGGGGSGGAAWSQRMRRLLLLEEGQAERDVLAFDTFNAESRTVSA